MTNVVVATVIGFALAAPPAHASGAQGGAPRSNVRPAGQSADPQAGPPAGAAQGRPGGRPGRGGPPPLAGTMGMTPTQVDKFFDNYVLFESRTALQLGDQEFLAFGARLERLQNLRRRQLQERRRIIGELAELARAEAHPDEAAVATRTKALDDLGQQSAEQLRLAYAEIDQVLTARQRARFRIFEENMERRKLELIALARQQTSGNQAARPNQPAANATAPNRRGGP